MNDNYSIIRAIRGPITLITLGILFAFQNFTRFGFDQTWPVLLIVFGVLSLLQRGAAPPTPPPPPAPPRNFPPAGYTSTSYSQSPYAQGGAAQNPGNSPTPGSSGGTV